MKSGSSDSERRVAPEGFAATLIGKKLGGRYTVRRILGEGGMGVVAEARQDDLDQAVAVKLMRPELVHDDALVARFLREARLAARTKSPHLVRVTDVGKLDDGTPYLVMELLAGRDLGAEIEERGALPVPTAVDYLLQACLGLSEIHALGFVHRDLKPSNLFLSDDGHGPTLRVLDLGITKDTNAKAGGSGHLTSTQHLLGTAHFMSPEQIKESKSVDQRTDVWALGVIAYNLLTGRLPFESDSGAIGELFGLVLFTEPKDARDIRPDLPEELCAVIRKCLSRDRDARYANVGELAVALLPFAEPAHQSRVARIKSQLATPAPVSQASGDFGLAHAPTDASSSDAILSSSPMKIVSSKEMTTKGELQAKLVAPVAISHTAVPVSKDSGVSTTTPRSRVRLALFVPLGLVVVGVAAFGLREIGKGADTSPAASATLTRTPDVPASVSATDREAPRPAPSSEVSSIGVDAGAIANAVPSTRPGAGTSAAPVPFAIAPSTRPGIKKPPASQPSATAKPGATDALILDRN